MQKSTKLNNYMYLGRMPDLSCVGIILCCHHGRKFWRMTSAAYDRACRKCYGVDSKIFQAGCQAVMQVLAKQKQQQQQ
jgi:hypothetical protein